MWQFDQVWFHELVLSSLSDPWCLYLVSFDELFNKTIQMWVNGPHRSILGPREAEDDQLVHWIRIPGEFTMASGLSEKIP